jgi:hypothetical protein
MPVAADRYEHVGVRFLNECDTGRAARRDRVSYYDPGTD